MQSNLRPGDVIEVHELHHVGEGDFADVWHPATIFALTEHRIDVVVQGGEHRGMLQALEPHARNRTWRMKVAPC
jgi:hypothetical protein